MQDQGWWWGQVRIRVRGGDKCRISVGGGGQV